MSQDDLIREKQLEINYVKHLLTKYPSDKDLLLDLNQLNLELQVLERPGKINRFLGI
ncbi:hypothetical protein POKO110462_17155 [Pontibacter korlensis]